MKKKKVFKKLFSTLFVKQLLAIIQTSWQERNKPLLSSDTTQKVPFLVDIDRWLRMSCNYQNVAT